MGTVGNHDVSSKKWLFICENEQVDFEVVLMMIWARKERNGVVWDGRFSEPLEVVQRTLSWLYGFQVANQPSRVEEPKQLWWLSPSDQWFKLNVDGTVKLKEGVGGAGGVIRGEGGGFRAAGVWSFQGIASVKQVELFVVREGLQLAKHWGPRILRRRRIQWKRWRHVWIGMWIFLVSVLLPGISMRWPIASPSQVYIAVIHYFDSRNPLALLGMYSTMSWSLDEFSNE